jgi:XRE family transcriptional regulator, master regulator for biofilm formation
LPEGTFGQRLKKLRMDRKLSLKALAQQLGISLPYLSQIEADLAIPSEPLARSIARYFNANEEELVFLARRVPKQLDELIEKFPNATEAYFRRVTKAKR